MGSDCRRWRTDKKRERWPRAEGNIIGIISNASERRDEDTTGEGPAEGAEGAEADKRQSRANK